MSQFSLPGKFGIKFGVETSPGQVARPRHDLATARRHQSTMGSCASKTIVRNARQTSLRQASGGPARPEMTTPKIAIVYYSMYGHVRTLALAEKKGLESAGCEVTLLKVPETLSDEVLGKMGAPGCVEIK